MVKFWHFRTDHKKAIVMKFTINNIIPYPQNAPNNNRFEKKCSDTVYLVIFAMSDLNFAVFHYYFYIVNY